MIGKWNDRTLAKSDYWNGKKIWLRNGKELRCQNTRNLIPLLKFNHPLIGAFTWLKPPGPYRATTCQERELNSGSYFFDHTRTWRASPDEGSVQCRAHLRDNSNIKEIYISHAPNHSNKANMKGWLWRPNDIRGPYGPKASWHLSYRWGKIPKKNSSGKPAPIGDRKWVHCVTGAHATACSTAVNNSRRKGCSEIPITNF